MEIGLSGDRISVGCVNNGSATTPQYWLYIFIVLGCDVNDRVGVYTRQTSRVLKRNDHKGSQEQED